MIDSQRKAKLKWQCRRGMLELDLILMRFVDDVLDDLTETELDTFESLLSAPDPQLYAWLMGTDSPADRELLSIVQRVKCYDNPG